MLSHKMCNQNQDTLLFFPDQKEGHFTFYTINKIASLRGAFLKVFIFYSITSSKMNA